MTSSTVKHEPYQLINDKMYEFPSTLQNTNFAIICSDEFYDDENPNPPDGRPVCAIGVNSQELSRVSPFFKDMFELASSGQDMWIKADAPSKTINFLLCAALNPSHSDFKEWGDECDVLNKALELCHEWRLDGARQHVFHAMLWLMSEEGDVNDPHLCPNVVIFEAASLNELALQQVANILRLRRRAGFKALRTWTFSISAHYYLLLDRKQLSRAVQAMMELVQDGALRVR